MWKLSWSQSPPLPVHYVHRIGEEQNLANAVISNTDNYPCIVGPNGGGKTTLAQAALRGVDGVIYCSLEEDSNLSPHKQILAALKIDASLDLVRILQRMRRWSWNWTFWQLSDWRPTLILSVKKSLDKDSAKALHVAIRALTDRDKDIARVIADMSDAVSVFMLPSDMRAEPLWLNDFTEDEANLYLDKRGLLVGDERKRRRVFEQVGTRVKTLKELCAELMKVNSSSAQYSAVSNANASDGVSNASDAVDPVTKVINEFIEKAHRDAYNTIDGLIELDGKKKLNGDAFKRLLIDLLKDEYKDGVPYARVADKYLAHPEDVVALFKKRHAILYDSTTGKFRFHSVAHRWAALEMEQDGILASPEKRPSNNENI